MKSEKDKLIELTPSQQNPYLARPEQFEVGEPNAPANISVPGHGQCGENEREQSRLLAERKPIGKGVALPLEPSDAEKPHSA